MHFSPPRKVSFPKRAGDDRDNRDNRSAAGGAIVTNGAVGTRRKTKARFGRVRSHLAADSGVVGHLASSGPSFGLVE